MAFTYKYIDDGTYAVMSYMGNETKIEIPAEYGGKPVTLLGDDLFKGHDEIEEVILPDSIKTIGGFVFDGCVKLKAVKLPEGLLDMWQYAFARSGIEIIEIPGSVVSVVPYTFKECHNLNLVVCHEGTRRIYANAFLDCDQLRMIAVHKDTQVSHEAFNGCQQMDPDLRIKLKSQCQCSQCTGKGKIDVKSLMKR